MEGWIPQSMRREAPDEISMKERRENGIIMRNLHRRVSNREKELDKVLQDNTGLRDEIDALRCDTQNIERVYKDNVSAVLRFTSNLRRRSGALFSGVDLDEAVLDELSAIEKQMFEAGRMIQLSPMRDDSESDKDKENYTPRTKKDIESKALRGLYQTPAMGSTSVGDTSTTSPFLGNVATTVSNKKVKGNTSFKVLGYMNKNPQAKSQAGVSSYPENGKRKSPTVTIMEKQVDSLKKQLSTALDQRKKEEENVLSLQVEMAALKQEHHREVEELCREIKCHEQRVGELTRDTESLKEANEEYEQRVGELTRHNEEYEQRVGELTRDTESLKEANEEYIAQVTSLKGAEADWQGQADAAMIERERLRNVNVESELRWTEESNRLHQALGAVQRQHDECKQREVDLRTEAKTVREEARLARIALEQNLASATATFASEKARIEEEAKEKEKELLTSLTSALKRSEDLQRCVDSSDKKNTILSKANADLASKLKDAKGALQVAHEKGNKEELERKRIDTEMIALTREAKDLKDAHKQHLLHVQAVEKEKEEVEGVLRDVTAAYESTMRRDEEGRRKEKEGAQAAKEKHKRQLELLRSQLSQMETRIHQTTVSSDEDRASLREELRVEREACRSAEAALLEEKGASKDQAALILSLEMTCAEQAGEVLTLSGQLTSRASELDAAMTASAANKQKSEQAEKRLQDMEVVVKQMQCEVAENINKVTNLTVELVNKEDSLHAAAKREKELGATIANLSCEVDVLSVQKIKADEAISSYKLQLEERDRTDVEASVLLLEAQQQCNRESEAVAGFQRVLGEKDEALGTLRARMQELEGTVLAQRVQLSAKLEHEEQAKSDEQQEATARLKQQMRDLKRQLRAVQGQLVEAELHRDAAVEVADKFLQMQADKASPGARDKTSPLTSLRMLTSGVKLRSSESKSSRGGVEGALLSPSSLSLSSLSPDAIGADQTLTDQKEVRQRTPTPATASPTTQEAQREVLRRTFCSFLAANTREEFTDRARLLCSLLEFPSGDIRTILSHLDRFTPYLAAMNVFDNFSVDLSSRFETLFFGEAAGEVVNVAGAGRAGDAPVSASSRSVHASPVQEGAPPSSEN